MSQNCAWYTQVWSWPRHVGQFRILTGTDCRHVRTASVLTLHFHLCLNFSLNVTLPLFYLCTSVKIKTTKYSVHKNAGSYETAVASPTLFFRTWVKWVALGSRKLIYSWSCFSSHWKNFFSSKNEWGVQCVNLEWGCYPEIYTTWPYITRTVSYIVSYEDDSTHQNVW